MKEISFIFKAILILPFLLLSFVGKAQQDIFPIKVNKQWGLMNADGLIILPPEYQAIGNFDIHGHAVMRKENKVGLINKKGNEIIPPLFEDLKTLDAQLCAVKKAGQWLVVNFEGKVLIDQAYEQVEVWDGKYVGYRTDGKWGIIHLDGSEIAKPTYDLINYFGEDHFLIHLAGKVGLLEASGKLILEPIAITIAPIEKNLFIFQQGKLYGLVSSENGIVKPADYQQVEPLGYNYLVLHESNNRELFNIPAREVIHSGKYMNYYELNQEYILVGKGDFTGLLDAEGKQLLGFDYDEIQLWSDQHFRVAKEGEWGIVDKNEEFLIEPEFEYIGPLEHNLAKVRNYGKSGLVNILGEILYACDYDEITIAKGEARALVNGQLSLLNLDDLGKRANENNFKNHFTITIGKKPEKNTQPSAKMVENKLLMQKFEWYYSAKIKRWGLRNLSDGSIKIPPKFDWIWIDQDLGITLVGMDQIAYQDFEFTSFRFEQVYGIINNERGALLGGMNYWDIKIEDFKEGLPLARVVLNNGRHGLIDRSGNLLQKDYAYIGPFQDGRARMSGKGKLSGTPDQTKSRGLGKLSGYLGNLLSPNLMIDYTRYDQYFEDEAQLICEDCLWGYFDENGEIIIKPGYEYAADFVNEVGIVGKKGKWGLINKDNEDLIPCVYDDIAFLENTAQKILKITTKSEKYGLIDTLGQVLVDLQYDEIGHFSEGRLAVKRNGLWGFVNQYGQEIIPCRFRSVNPFQEGLATVKLSNSWGVIDKQGDKVLDFNFTKIGNFVNGLAWANYRYKIGFINTKGQFVIPPKFEKAFDFEGDLARVVSNGKYGLINASGQFILRPRFSRIEAFNELGSAIYRQHGEMIRYGLIDRKGNVLTTQRFSMINGFREGRAVVRLKGKYGFIDQKGNLIIDNRYSKVADFSNGRAVVQRNGACGYIDLNGTEVIDLQFSKCLDFKDDKAVVYKGYKQGGIIDLHGNYIIEPSLNRLYGFQEGRGLVRDKSLRFYYISEENKITQGYYEQAGQFHHGIALVQSNGKWGVINQQGASIVPPKYDKIEDFVDGFAKVRIKTFTGLSNLKGEFIIPPQYEYISYAGEGLFRVEKGDKLGYFNQEGKWVWDLQE